MEENQSESIEPAHYQHNPTKPTREQWNQELQAERIQKCLINCKKKAEGGVTCLTLTNLLLAQESHRTTWPMDGPLYVKKDGKVACIKNPEDDYRNI